MTDYSAKTPPFPCMSAAHAAMVVRQCADITLQISDRYVIEDIHVAPELDAAALKEWLGKPLAEIVSADSQSKLGLVVGDNCASDAIDSRWHEMNFRTAGGDVIALHVKFFRMVLDDEHAHLLCARDLTPVGQLKDRFQREINNVERRARGKLPPRT